MAKLAIEGHKTRGKEVIAILEMLGGINVDNLNGDDMYYYYYITDDKEIDSVLFKYSDDKARIFSLEEFEEKYPYKVGDKVYNIIHNENQTITDLAWDSKENEVVYQTNNNEYVFVNYLQPYKKETMEEQKQIPPYMDYDIRTEENMEETIKIDIPKGYEFFGIDDDNKVVLTKKQFQYPKTYKECCDVLGCDKNLVLGTMPMKYKVLINLQKLLICRDAYWKIAGEQMGLGKPWEPDYHEKSYEQGSPIKYVIYYTGTHITKEQKCTPSYILAFPTEEMRDNFFENFKELIEQCNELL